MFAYKNSKKSSIKRTERFYYLFFGLLLFLYMVQCTVDSFIDSLFHDIGLGIALVFALCCFAHKRYTIKKTIIAGVLDLIGVVCYLSSGNSRLLLMLLVITLAPSMDIDRTIRFMFKMKLVFFLCVIILSQTNLIQSQMVEVSKGTYSVKCSSLGFGHPNIVAMQASTILLLYLCSRRMLSNYHICIAMVLTGVIFAVTQCRTALLLLSFFCILISLRKNVRVQQIVFGLLPYVHILAIFGIVVLLLFYDRHSTSNAVVQFINGRIFNGRVGLSWSGLKIYPSSLFGIGINYDVALRTMDYFALDNGQVSMWLSYGVFGFASCFYVIQSALNQIHKQKKYAYAIAAMVFIVYSMYENPMYDICNNFIFLFGAMALQKSEEDIVQKGKFI